MSTSTTEHGAADGASVAATATRKGSLLRAEVHRILARRFVRLLLVVGVLGFGAICVGAAVTHSKPTAAVLEQARQARDRDIAEQTQFHEACLNDPNRPQGQPVDEVCGPAPSELDWPVENYIEKRPFTRLDDVPNIGIAVGVGTAAILFVIAATYIGAEWSARSIVALLFWEPRRLRVLGGKTAVIIGFAAVVAALAQTAWTGAAQAIAATRGVPEELPPHYWSHLVAQDARGVALGVIVAVFGFSLANLLRNTGAALGVGFVYFAILENAIRIARPTWDAYLFTTNAVALMMKGGYKIRIPERMLDTASGTYQDYREIVVSNAHGAAVLSIYCAVVLVVGAVLFKRRDLH